MLKNYFKTAIRSIIRERYYAIIKIVGLALGLGTTMVIFQFVSHELSYDKFHRDADRIYDVLQTNIWASGTAEFMNSTGPAVSFGLVTDFPEIEEVMRINTPGGQVVRYTKADGDIVAINEGMVLAADSNFFSFFDFKLKAGNSKTALQGVGKVVISDKAAKRLFGEENALGKIIMMGDKKIAVEVTGVTEKQPTNAHFNFDYLISMPTNPAVKEFDWSWIWTQVVTYVKLKPGADVVALNEKLKTFADRHAPATFQYLRMDYELFKRERGGGWQLRLQPVTDIHLQSYKTMNRLGPDGDVRYVYIFSAIGVFILLIAIINFINLSTARGAKRAKEVGVKKTLGVLRRSLIIQFQIEHIIMTFLAMLLALGVMEILRLAIQPIAGIEIPASPIRALYLVLLLLLTPIVIGFLSGLYPAFYLTSFQPVQVLKGKILTGFRKSTFRNALVIFQFSISILLMVSTMIVFQQLNFYQTKDVGFTKENMLVIEAADKLGNQLESFQKEIMQFPGVVTASITTDIRDGFEDMFFKEGSDSKLSASHYKVDHHFFETTKMTLAAGRAFEEERPSDQNAVLLTETTSRLMGWTPKEALGKRVAYIGDEVGPQEVIGVVKDFHLQSLRENIQPVIFFNSKSEMYGENRVIFLRYATDDVQSLIQQISARWNQLSDGVPLAYSFYDQQVKMQYAQENRIGSMFLIFTALSITIAILGLVGLVSYSAEQRKKEIGVRKVFGASLAGIYVMMNKEYVKLMFVALLIATPSSYWIMTKWLETIPEANRIAIEPTVFIVAFLAELVLALLCVGYLAIRAASLNPSVVLKEE